jgi:hypothetical protein
MGHAKAMALAHAKAHSIKLRYATYSTTKSQSHSHEVREARIFFMVFYYIMGKAARKKSSDAD